MNVNIDRFLSGVEHFRTLDPEIPSQVIQLFIIISRNQGETLTTIADKAGQTLTSASRNAYALSAWRKHQVQGFDLVALDPDPYDRRKQRVTLTNKGRKFIDTLSTLLK